MLSFVFPSHFLHEDILNRLTSLLELDDESVAPHILAALTFLGKYRPLSECKLLYDIFLVGIEGHKVAD